MFLLAERNAITLTALLDSWYTAAPHSLWERCLCAVYMCVLYAHTRVLVQLTSECAAGEREGVPCFCSHTTRFPVFPSSCPLGCFRSLLVEAELLGSENGAPNGEFAVGKGHTDRLRDLGDHILLG